MSRIWLQRLGALVLLAWLAAGALAWLALDPPAALVGARRAVPVATPDLGFTPPDIGAVRAALEESLMWGVQRDGNPLPPPKKAEELAKKIEWRLLAAVERQGERLLVIQIEKDKPQTVREGELLPDGGKVLKVRRDAVSIGDAEGNSREIKLVVE
ncbi:MAG: hypothetical protein IT512_02940 [Rhodocyclaceae bacterium]|nr:hypothetical protein [Rhodocyclaceae bacterium]